MRVEFIGTSVVTLAATFAVVERSGLGPGYAGLSISYALQLTGILNWLVVCDYVVVKSPHCSVWQLRLRLRWYQLRES